MIGNIVRSKRVWVGVCFLGILIIASIIYPYVKDTLPQPGEYLYNEKGQLTATAPYTPLQVPPFGSDRLGVPLLYKIIEGAKYTIGFALMIGFFRVLIGMAIGVWLSLYCKRFKSFIKRMSESFYNIPTIFMAYILMAPVYISLNQYDSVPSTQWIVIMYQLTVAVGVAVPAIAIFTANEVDEYMKQEYIISAKLMGATKWHLIRTHIQLFLREKAFILFMQHVVQALTLFVHLGLLRLFIGGERIIEIDMGVYKPVSLTNEWSGLVGLDRYEFNLAPWIVLSPLCAFAITIFFLNLMTEGIKDALNKQPKLAAASQNRHREVHKKQHTSEKELFTLVNTSMKHRANHASFE
jgi:peptide/nickel transport system permease protein